MPESKSANGSRPFPELMHRALFKSVSVLPSRGQAAVLRRYFDWWHRSPDPWHLQTDDYEQQKYATTLRTLPERPYNRILDVGCAEGVFTHALAGAYPDAEVTGVDVSERALNRARARPGTPRPGFARADLLSYDRHHAFDLVVCAETLYYLGRDDRLRAASAALVRFVRPGGLLALVHPWPESQQLHAYVGGAMSQVAEHVEEKTHRPFAVTVFEAGPSR
ncbi:methyltransferase domain-containing protein [Nonomuraea sp. K274]|uniref:Methyltransferase domain-containing protein n=1 Tax=Nonomuraea cypriaca TaxID=1187855 RepID=A0A931A945_9ACTN|nr:class I SAM-dependent methyltransferase [Nonomuraea cypriaca]MBF8185714.1 methyltransferase domain-containing protein [Nonomuraea cypriaca]